MSFSDEVLAVRKPTGMKCSVCQLLPTLDAKLRAEVVAAIKDDRLPMAAIKDACEKRGWKIGMSSIRTHRTGSHQ